jgi:hypothetical protein
MAPDIAAPPLPQIPLIDIGDGGAVALFKIDPARAAEIIRLSRAQYGTKLVAGLDTISRLWSTYARNTHNGEIVEIAGRLPRGVWFMNLCLKWGCTSGVMMDPTAPGMRLLQTVDWSFRRLGRNLVVARQFGPAGDYYNMTWPGFTGVVQAMAPGRFTVATNQAPLVRRMTLPIYVDWLVNKIKTFSGRQTPPGHLLCGVVETCRNYQEAHGMLSKTPIVVPAIFSLASIDCGEGCVIVRLERRAAILEAPAAAANHWVGKTFKPGRERDIKSYRRHRLMNGYTLSQVTDFAWATYPVVNEDTRLAMSTNPRTRELRVQGFEADGPATQVFDLSHHAGARRTKGVL